MVWKNSQSHAISPQVTGFHIGWGLNSHCFHIGDSHQPNSRLLYTEYKDSSHWRWGLRLFPKISPLPWPDGTYHSNHNKMTGLKHSLAHCDVNKLYKAAVLVFSKGVLLGRTWLVVWYFAMGFSSHRIHVRYCMVYWPTFTVKIKQM